MPSGCSARHTGQPQGDDEVVDEGLDLVEQAYPGWQIPAKVRFLLTEIVDSMQH